MKWVYNIIYGNLYWLEWAETCTDERLCTMKVNKCEKYCGNCFPLTITIDCKQFVYRYGSAQNRRVGLGMLRAKYQNKKLYPVYACALLHGGQNDS